METQATLFAALVLAGACAFAQPRHRCSSF